MWLITNFGFFSIVEKPNQKGSKLLTIRARVKEDLEQLRKQYLSNLGDIQTGGGSDYKYRAVAPRTAIAEAFAKAIRDIDYSNFKSSVADKQGSHRAHLYHGLWSILFKLQQKEASKPTATTVKSDAKKATPAKTAGSVHQLPGPLDDDLPATVSCGSVIFDGRGRVLLRKPAGEFDGYVWTFPKGKRTRGESLEEAAVREAREECGVDAEIVRRIPGVFRGGTGLNIYFEMRLLKDYGDYDEQETERVRWATLDEAASLICQTRNAVGQARDLAVLQAAHRSA